MKIGRLLIPSALAFGLVGIVCAQGPLYDKVIVDLPYSVTIQNKTLTPGEYTIRQLPGEGQSRVLLIYSDNGTRFETSSMTIPTLSNRTPDDTSVVLHHFGNDYYFDKIWVQGKNYGYEFPLPDAVKARERERAESVSLAAKYQATPIEAQEQQQTQTMAQNTPPPPVQQETQPAQPAPAPEPQAAPTPAPEPQAAPAPAPVQMPRTDANWLAFLFGGGLLSGTGLLFRRLR